VGASGAVLYKRWRRGRSHRVRQQLAVLAVIVAFQTVFDLVTPQVSFGAHFGGALLGLVLGVILRVERGPSGPGAARSAPTHRSS
jgi:rhomboid protease GluP